MTWAAGYGANSPPVEKYGYAIAVVSGAKNLVFASSRTYSRLGIEKISSLTGKIDNDLCSAQLIAKQLTLLHVALSGFGIQAVGIRAPQVPTLGLTNNTTTLAPISLSSQFSSLSILPGAAEVRKSPRFRHMFQRFYCVSPQAY